MSEMLPIADTLTPDPALIDVRAVAALCGCSTRHVFRLADAGKMPAPLHVGHLVRWNATEVRDWINAGCPAIKEWEARRRLGC